MTYATLAIDATQGAVPSPWGTERGGKGMDERAVESCPVQKLKLAEQAAGLQVLVAFENRLDPWPGEPTARGKPTGQVSAPVCREICYAEEMVFRISRSGTESGSPGRRNLYLAHLQLLVRILSRVFLDAYIGLTRGRRNAMCQSKADGGRRCKPNKGRHSSAAAIGTAGSVPQRLSAQIRRTRKAVLRDAKEQLGDLLDAVADAAPVDSAVSLVSVVDADAADQIADAITASLKANGWPRSKWRSHLLCGALTATAHAMEAGEALAKTLVTQGVTAALTSAGAPGPVADMAARAAVDVLMKLTPYRHWDDIHRGVQLLAVALCPAVENHPEVVEYCLRPLASERLSDVLRQELAVLSGDSAVAAS
jgi:hypothetical protein